MLKGISPLISMVIVILVTVIAVAIAILVAVPTINQAKEAALINEAKQNMHQIDDSVREVASEGLGSLRNLNMKVSGGQYQVNGPGNSIDFTYAVKYGTVQAGTFIQDGNLQIIAGTDAKASVYNLSTPMPANDTSQIVLENENIRIALHYNASANASFPETMNTSQIIQRLNFKSTNVNVTPSDSAVTIDNFPDTAVGTGYAYIVKPGDHLATAEAIFVVNTTRLYYEIRYSLPSGSDFLIAKIQNAYYH